MKNLCAKCLSDLLEADALGFIDNFRLLQNGSLHFPETNRIYDLDDINIDIVKTCLQCSKSTYFIITSDGIKGKAVEYWEF